jgi:hypothetical protein
MNMPTYERRFYIEMYKNEMEQREETINEQKKRMGKGRVTRRISGDELKRKIKNGEIQ